MTLVKVLAFCLAWCAILVATLSADNMVRVSVRIVDQHGALTPARAWIDVDGERYFRPMLPDSVTVYPRDRSFSCDGEFSIEVPSGDAVLHVEKGKEFMVVELRDRFEAGSTIEKTVPMKRWINMPEKGWYSADLHVHLGQDNPRVLKQLALADDVHVVPAFTYWLRGTEKAWNAEWPDERYLKPIVIDAQHIITRNNIEIERIASRAEPGGSVGATFLFNLNRPVTATKYGEHFPTDARLCEIARRHSPAVVLDSDKPSWAETVVGAAVGMLDTIQLCHNHYHRSSTLPGGWGMIGPLSPGESNQAAGDGLFYRTNQLYYRFLNCGFRLGVSGGSAIGVMAVPTGYNRVYAQVDGPLTAEKVWRAIREGRSFATSGPMLELQVEGQGPGAMLKMNSASDSTITAEVHVQSVDVLEALQIIHNGAVLASHHFSNPSSEQVTRASLNRSIEPARSGWLAARAIYRAPDGMLRQAHTSPVYISVDNKPTASAEDARYMLRWLDRLEAIAKQGGRFPSENARDQVLASYADARKVYQNLLDVASAATR